MKNEKNNLTQIQKMTQIEENKMSKFKSFGIQIFRISIKILKQASENKGFIYFQELKLYCK